MTALAWCKDNSNTTFRDICTWIVFIVVLCVVLHACLGVSKSSPIRVNKHLSNNITDGSVPLLGRSVRCPVPISVQLHAQVHGTC